MLASKTWITNFPSW